MLRNQLTSIWRNLRSNFAYATINTVGLTLGITCAVVIYTFISYERNFDNFHKDTDRIYRVVQLNHTSEQTQYWNTTAYTLAKAIRTDFPEVQVTQSAGPLTRIISSDVGGQVIRHELDKILFADFNYLQLFNFDDAYEGQPFWLEGSAGSAFDKLNATIITEEIAARYFPDAYRNGESLLGKVLLLNNKDPLEITGVVRNPPKNTTLLFEMLINYEFFAVNNPYFANNWSGNYQGYTYIKLADQHSAENFEAQLSPFKKKYLNEDDNKRIEYRLQPVDEIHTSEEFGTSIGSYVISSAMLNSLALIGILVLLIAVINYINLATAQSLKRSKEVGIKKILGSSRSNLFSQFLLETFVLTLIATLHGYAFSQLIIDWLNGYLFHINLDLTLHHEVYWFLAALLVSTSLIAGFYPALLISGYSPLKAVLSNNDQKIHKFNLRNALVIFQFTVVQVLLVATVIASQQMDFFNEKDLGFNSDGLLTVNVPTQSAEALDNFKTQLNKISAVEKVSYSSGIPLAPNRQYGTSFRFSHQPVALQKDAEMKVVGLDYLEMYGLNLVAGRWLNESNITGDRSFNGFVVNETLVQMLETTPEEILGRKISINEGTAPVIGVISDFHNMGLQKKITPCLLFNWTGFISEVGIRYNVLADDAEVLAQVERSWKNAFPEKIFKYEFIEDYIAANYQVEQLIYDAFRVSAALAIIIGCLGLYGLISFVSKVKTKEIGIRRTLGASVYGIVVLLSSYFIRMLLVSIMLGSVIAWIFMDEWLREFVYRIDMNPLFFLISAALTIVLALLSTGFNMVKAAVAYPVDNLRE